MGEVDGEGDQPAAGEHGPHRLDVGQVIAADLGKVEEPHVAVAQPRRGTRLRNSFTVKPITPRWMGMSRPWAMRRPSASVSADERSPASLRSGERAERMMMTLISSAIA